MSNPIFKALDAQFTKHRILFWYDEEGKQRHCFDDYTNADVEKIAIDNNELAVKHYILKSDDTTRFLVYFPLPKPADEDNWLLDLCLQHFIFATDQAAMMIQELGIDPMLEPVMDQYLDFFTNRNERLNPLKVALSQFSSPLREEDLCTAMLGVIAADTRAEREHGKTLADLCIRPFRTLHLRSQEGIGSRLRSSGWILSFGKELRISFDSHPRIHR